MKTKALTIILSLCIAFAVTACGKTEADTSYEAGRAYLYGLDGQEKDVEAAYANFQTALELGKTEANFYLGVLCDWESYPEQDYEQAKTYYEAAGDNPYAQIALGLLYLNGQGVEKSEEKAQELFDSAIAQGCADGYYGTAQIAYKRTGDANYDIAMEDFTKVAEAGTEQLYIREALYYIGWMYHSGGAGEQDYDKAVEWYEKAAKLGNTRAMTTLGDMYMSGFGMAWEKWDGAKAAEWYEKAVEAGDTRAMSRLGDMYKDGYRVEQDTAKADEWYVKAFESYAKEAQAGDKYAMRTLGDMYMIGRGVKEDGEKAITWYMKAADAGLISAMGDIAHIYGCGLAGIEQDEEKAAEWQAKYDEARLAIIAGEE